MLKNRTVLATKKTKVYFGLCVAPPGPKVPLEGGVMLDSPRRGRVNGLLGLFPPRFCFWSRALLSKNEMILLLGVGM